MSWGSVSNKRKSYAKIEIIEDGIDPVDARIFFGKFCHDINIGVLLSDIIHQEKGKGYIRWMRDNFDGIDPDQYEQFIQVCNDLL